MKYGTKIALIFAVAAAAIFAFFALREITALDIELEENVFLSDNVFDLSKFWLCLYFTIGLCIIAVVLLLATLIRQSKSNDVSIAPIQISSIEEEEKTNSSDEKLALFTAKANAVLEKPSELTTSSLLSECAHLLQAGIGIWYSENEQKTHYVANSFFAFKPTNENGETIDQIQLDEGLIQAAVDTKKPIVLDEIPENFPKLESGLGNTSPRALCILPVRLGEHLVGALEIGFFAPLSNLKKREIELLATLLQSKGGQS